MQYAVRSTQFRVRSRQCAVRGFLFSVSCFRLAILTLFLLVFADVNAQHTLWMNSDVPTGRDSAIQRTAHGAIKPYVDMDVIPADTVHRIDAEIRPSKPIVLAPRLSMSSAYSKRAPLYNYVSAADLSHTMAFAIRPLYDLRAGFDMKENRFLMNAIGGVVLDADYKQKLGIEARFVSGITTLPNYQDSLALHHSFVPGWGDRAYWLDSAKYGFQHFTGNIIWRPTPVFNLQVGRDKHFWGDGHRSLFLGDQGPAFPYIKAQTTIWKLQYTSLFAWLQDWTQSTGSSKDFRSKFASFHYLSFNAAKWLNISVFEAVVWQGTDDNRQRWFDPNYLNPLVFFRPVEYSLGSSDNAMLGLAGKIRFNRNNVLYAQVILDEFYLKEIKNWSAGWWANKQGAQVGYKCYNFGQVDNLFMQVEMNVVRPYTYSHGSPQQSYTNGPLPLAHPMGANFAEVMGMLSYYRNGLTVTGEVVGIRYGKDVNDTMNYGQNVFQSYITRESDYGNKVFQGYATNIFLAKLNASYVFNTKFPLRVQLTAIARSERTKIVERKLKSSFVMVGLSLPLYRAQDDY